MLFVPPVFAAACRWLLIPCAIVAQVSQVCVGQQTSQATSTEASTETTPPTLTPKIFLIGNSLTWDTLPGLLDGDVQWHVDCGKNLKFIHDNPAAPCVKTSTLWPEALSSKQYDLLCVQPHFGTSLDEDVAAISAWLKLQPTAALVIHTGWNRAAEFNATYHHKSTNTGQMIHSPSYFQSLTKRLLELHPHRNIRTTSAIDVLNQVYEEIQQGQAPFKNFTELFRDEIHMNTQVGRYLMHNLMRIALNQPLSDQGFQIDAPQKKYITQKLSAMQQGSQLKPAAKP